VFNLIKLSTHLKTVLIAASNGLAGGDMLPVVVISSLFNAVHRGAKSKGRSMQCHAPADCSRAERRR
jgi:hypothetical protein